VMGIYVLPSLRCPLTLAREVLDFGSVHIAIALVVLTNRSNCAKMWCGFLVFGREYRIYTETSGGGRLAVFNAVVMQKRGLVVVRLSGSCRATDRRKNR